eukprot:GAHX01004556.1.p4 GENE.GAHX01004556.1~~GAHX01004556.1.p4  ORF type:complete len:53 (+),score=1.50 GAHX01004556.1:746-904(+)
MAVFKMRSACLNNYYFLLEIVCNAYIDYIYYTCTSNNIASRHWTQKDFVLLQ